MIATKEKPKQNAGNLIPQINRELTAIIASVYQKPLRLHGYDQVANGDIVGVFSGDGEVYQFLASPDKGKFSYVEAKPVNKKRVDSYLVGWIVDSGSLKHSDPERFDAAVKGKKKCGKGKQCGDTCIEKGLECDTELGDGAKQQLKETGKKVEKAKSSGKKMPGYNILPLVLFGTTLGAQAYFAIRAAEIQQEINREYERDFYRRQQQARERARAYEEEYRRQRQARKEQEDRDNAAYEQWKSNPANKVHYQAVYEAAKKKGFPDQSAEAMADFLMRNAWKSYVSGGSRRQANYGQGFSGGGASGSAGRKEETPKTSTGKNWWSVLNVNPNASPAEVKRAWKEALRRAHPDVNPDDPRAKEKSQEINEAYEKAKKFGRNDSLLEIFEAYRIAQSYYTYMDSEFWYREDKPCGQSQIPDNRKCHKSTSDRPSNSESSTRESTSSRVGQVETPGGSTGGGSILGDIAGNVAGATVKTAIGIGLYVGVNALDRHFQIREKVVSGASRAMTAGMNAVDLNGAISILPIPEDQKAGAKNLAGVTKVAISRFAVEHEGAKLLHVDPKNNFFTYKLADGSFYSVTSVGSRVLTFSSDEDGTVGEDKLYQMRFRVDGRFARGKMDRKEGLQLVKQIKAVYADHLEKIPDGSHLTAIAYKDDGAGESRSNIYQKSGFSSVAGKEDKGRLWAIKRGGKLVSPSPQEARKHFDDWDPIDDTENPIFWNAKSARVGEMKEEKERAKSDSLRLDRGVKCGGGWIKEGLECHAGKGKPSPKPRNPKPAQPPTPVASSGGGGGVAKTLISLLGMAAAGGAIAYYSSKWGEGKAEARVNEAKRAVAAKLQGEINDLRKAQAAAIERVRVESERQKNAEIEKIKASVNETAKSKVAKIKQAAIDADKKREAEAEALKKKLEEDSVKQTDEDTAAIRKAYAEKLSEIEEAGRQVERERRKLQSAADIALDVKAKALDAEYEEKTAARIAELEQEYAQKLEEAKLRLQREQTEEIGREREKAWKDASKQIEQAIAPKGAKGTLINDDEKGVSMWASVNNPKGGMPISSEPDNRQKLERRVVGAVGTTAAKGLKRGIDELSLQTRNKIKQLTNNPKFSDRRSIAWGKVKDLFAAQTDREGALSERVEAAEKKAANAYRSLLKSFHESADKGDGYSDALLKSFDRESQKIHSRMQKEVQDAINYAAREYKTRWDSGNAYQGYYQEHLATVGRFDKKCGKSQIPDNRKCHKGEGSSSSDEPKPSKTQPKPSPRKKGSASNPSPDGGAGKAKDLPSIDTLKKIQSSKGPDWLKAAMTGAAIVGVSAASYMALRARYRAGFEESARMAKAKSRDVEVPEIPKGKKEITFTVGGFYGYEGEAGARKGEDYFHYKMGQEILGNKQNPGGDHFMVQHRNKKFNVSGSGAMSGTPAGHVMDTIEHYRTILKPVLIDGRNPEAVDLAAEVMAYHSKYPKKPINLVGHSAGGMITHETAEILNKAGIKVKIVNLASGYFGLTEKVGESYTVASKQDLYLKTIPGTTRDTVSIGNDDMPNPDAHRIRHYMNDPESRKTIKNLLSPPKRRISASGAVKKKYRQDPFPDRRQAERDRRVVMEGAKTVKDLNFDAIGRSNGVYR